MSITDKISAPLARLVRISLVLAVAALSGCASVGSSGPSTGRVMKAGQQSIEAAGIRIIDLTGAVSRRVADANQQLLFSRELGFGAAEPTTIGAGDVLDISIVEAPPAVLFSGSMSAAQLPSEAAVRPTTVSSGLSLPQQMVDLNGRISVPFAGSIQAAGLTPSQIEREIVARLRGKAHDPQAIVRRSVNASSTVTVLGDVGQSGRIPITSKGERLLDVLATAGGARQSVSKSVVQITRGARSITLPLGRVVSDGGENIILQPNDVVTVYYQPFTFTVLGATGTNAEVPLEGTVVSLSQALGRIGGLQDSRADIRGVFVFRFEDAKALDPLLLAGVRTTREGKVPVIYRVDLKNPATLLVAQTFPIKNKDVVYVANAPLAEFAKFANIVTGLTYAAVNLGTTVVR